MSVPTDLSAAHRTIRGAGIAIAMLACALALSFGRPAGVFAAAGISSIAVILVVQVQWLVRYHYHRSKLAHRAASRAEEHHIDVLRRIIRFTEAREGHAPGRSERIGRLAGQIARELGLPEETCDQIRLAGQLHDIGSLAVPEAILARRGRLGPDESHQFQKHSEVSYEVLKPLRSLAEVLSAVRHHHERMNGTGYPAGLAGGDIPLGARILAAADAYDAMTHDRPQRPAVAPLVAMKELQRCSPAGYDAPCVEALARVVRLPQLEYAVAAGRPV